MSDKTTPKQVKSTLAILSHGAAALDDAYSEALERIEGQKAGHVELAKNALTWITFAKRPLTTVELCCALAVEPGEAELDPDNIPDVNEIVSVCAGLVVVDQESAIVRLVHYTTQEYFERINSRLSPHGESPIAETCFTYLSFRVFESGSCTSDEGFEKRLREYELLEYAAKYCAEHARPVQAEVAHLACTLLSDSGQFACAAQILFLPGHRRKEYSAFDPATTTMHWIARSNLREVAKQFLSITKDNKVKAVNAKDGQSRSPLLFAAEYGHHEVAEFLLDRGADVNAQDQYDRTALHAAVYGDHEIVVRLLLENGADVNAQDAYGSSALQQASSNGNEAVVRLLLDRGADVNAQNSALAQASFNDNEAIVKLLLDNGADINAQNKYGKSALHEASLNSNQAVVRLLLDNGADVDVQDAQGASALEEASFEGNEAVVRLLLDNGANVNAQDKSSRSALKKALYGGNNVVVKLLLDRGANFSSAQERDGALQQASYEGNEAVVRLLLENGADVNARSENHGYALYAAVRGNHEAVVRLLLENGANVNARSEKYDYALHTAVHGNHEEVVKLLLENGADVNACSKNHGFAVHAAVHGDFEAVARLLLEKGADISTPQGPCTNALQAAAYAGHDYILRRWMKIASPQQLTDPYDRTILWWAAAGDQITTVRLLISQYNQDPRVPDKFGCTPLWIATKKGHDAVSEFLLEEFGTPGSGQRPLPDHSVVQDPSRMFCDVCTSIITETGFYYHCRHCSGGYWDVCEDCKRRGAYCSDQAHILIKRTGADDYWKECDE